MTWIYFFSALIGWAIGWAIDYWQDKRRKRSAR